ncbi:actin family [Geopyxis carbonaria]|nr:actin family [Geopyxis carbonaria]
MPPAKAKVERRTLIIDNGSYTIKAGFAKPDASYDDCTVVPNCLARPRDSRRGVLVGAQLDSCKDFGGMAFRRPVEKGYLVNWEAEKEIWDRTFLDPESPLYCDPRNTNLILTEAPNAPLSLQSNTDQMVFEEYEFASYMRCVVPSLVPWNDIPLLYTPGTPPPTTRPAEAVLVVDSGFSHTHIVPLINGQPYHIAVRRIDIGGKFLTNNLKELVSLRTWNMMEEPHLINTVKEACCFVSTAFNEDLEVCRRRKPAENPLVLDYVLPDYNTGRGGFSRPHTPVVINKKSKSKAAAGSNADGELIMTLTNERFAVPELLFNPSDVGLKQAGVVEATMQSLEMVPEALRPILLANIVLVGGNANLPGYQQRFEEELRPLAPAEATVRVAVPEDPVKYAWLGGVHMALDGKELANRSVSRKEYIEHGLAWAQRKMAGGNTNRSDTPAKESSAERERRESRSHKKRKVGE